LPQGFTKEITMPREQWVGYIKDYDGGTLMEYVIHPKIPYADLVGMFRVRTAAVSAGQQHTVRLAPIGAGVVAAGDRLVLCTDLTLCSAVSTATQCVQAHILRMNMHAVLTVV
jgi:hypothetical protein